MVLVGLVLLIGMLVLISVVGAVLRSAPLIAHDRRTVKGTLVRVVCPA